MKYFLPVLHYLDDETTYDQADLLFNNGADGLFLISHMGEDRELNKPITTLMGSYPNKLFGLNLLQSNALNASRIAVALGVDMVWSDYCGVSSEGITDEAIALSNFLAGEYISFFGSVAFKYQKQEVNPAKAACYAADLGFIPTTSGDCTGKAPELPKISNIWDTLALSNSQPKLAIASGLTLNNVQSFMPYTTHFLVSTGLSLDETHFDADKVKEFAEIVHSTN